MRRLNGLAQENSVPPIGVDGRAIRQLVKAQDVATKLGVSISWVVQHASGKRKPYLPAVKMGPGRSPLRFDPSDVESSLKSVAVLLGNAQRTPAGEFGHGFSGGPNLDTVPNVLTRLLVERQLPSGGWSYLNSPQDSIEATSLGVMALRLVAEDAQRSG